MADFVLKITEVTRMRSLYCVAGWSPVAKRMVRPLPKGEYWSLQQLQFFGSDKIVKPGLQVRFRISNKALSGDFPHRTENVTVDEKIELAGKGASFIWFGDEAPYGASTLAEAFPVFLRGEKRADGAIKGNFIPAGSQTHSLCGLNLPAESLRFKQEINYKGNKQLRAEFIDVNGRYNLPVVAKNLLDLYDSDGVDCVNRSLPTTGRLHIRIGLARPFDNQPNQCYVMMNGVNW